MKYPIGPHQREGRRRRRLKAVVLVALLSALLLTSTLSKWTPPEQANEPSIQELATARNLYRISGDRGFAHEYIQAWPEYADYIMGK